MKIEEKEYLLRQGLLCSSCKKPLAKLARYRTPAEGETQILTRQCFTKICRNAECSAYINTSLVKTWKLIN